MILNEVRDLNRLMIWARAGNVMDGDLYFSYIVANKLQEIHWLYSHSWNSKIFNNDIKGDLCRFFRDDETLLRLNIFIEKMEQGIEREDAFSSLKWLKGQCFENKVEIPKN